MHQPWACPAPGGPGQVGSGAWCGAGERAREGRGGASPLRRPPSLGVPALCRPAAGPLTARRLAALAPQAWTREGARDACVEYRGGTGRRTRLVRAFACHTASPPRGGGPRQRAHPSLPPILLPNSPASTARSGPSPRPPAPRPPVLHPPLLPRLQPRWEAGDRPGRGCPGGAPPLAAAPTARRRRRRSLLGCRARGCAISGHTQKTRARVSMLPRYGTRVLSQEEGAGGAYVKKLALRSSGRRRCCTHSLSRARRGARGGRGATDAACGASTRTYTHGEAEVVGPGSTGAKRRARLGGAERNASVCMARKCFCSKASLLRPVFPPRARAAVRPPLSAHKTRPASV